VSLQKLKKSTFLLRAQIHSRIKKGILDGYPSSALPWLTEDTSDILSIFPFLSDRPRSCTKVQPQESLMKIYGFKIDKSLLDVCAFSFQSKNTIAHLEM
jgi:hypothetical protein